MKSLAIVGLILIPVALIGGLVYGGIVFPIWACVHLAQSDLDKKTRTTWTLVLIFTWALGALVYGAVHKGRDGFKKGFVAAAAFWTMFVVFLAGSILITSAKMPGMNAAMAVQNSVAYDQADSSELTLQQKTALKTAMDSMEIQSKTATPLDMLQTYYAARLHLYLKAILDDRSLSSREYEDFMRYFETARKGKLDSDALERDTKTKMTENKEQASRPRSAKFVPATAYDNVAVPPA